MTPPPAQFTARLTRRWGAWRLVLTIGIEAAVACARTCGSTRDWPAVDEVVGDLIKPYAQRNVHEQSSRHGCFYNSKGQW